MVRNDKSKKFMIIFTLLYQEGNFGGAGTPILLQLIHTFFTHLKLVWFFLISLLFVGTLVLQLKKSSSVEECVKKIDIHISFEYASSELLLSLFY